MNKLCTFPERGRSFAKGDYLVHVSGVVGITTGEVIYEPKNPVEKTRIILKSGHPLVDYSVKFCIASPAEQSNLYDRLEQNHRSFRPNEESSSRSRGNGG